MDNNDTREHLEEQRAPNEDYKKTVDDLINIQNKRDADSDEEQEEPNDQN